eukprot:363696-Chlamydomonas_euryale.AAC.11
MERSGQAVAGGCPGGGSSSGSSGGGQRCRRPWRTWRLRQSAAPPPPTARAALACLPYFSTSTAELWPPEPKLFDIAARTWRSILILLERNGRVVAAKTKAVRHGDPHVTLLLGPRADHGEVDAVLRVFDVDARMEPACERAGVESLRRGGEGGMPRTGNWGVIWLAGWLAGPDVALPVKGREERLGWRFGWLAGLDVALPVKRRRRRLGWWLGWPAGLRLPFRECRAGAQTKHRRPCPRPAFQATMPHRYQPMTRSATAKPTFVVQF